MAGNFPEATINFNTVPALRSVAAVKISITLWTQADVIDYILLCINRLTLEECFVDVFGKVRKKIRLLPLPNEMLNEVLGVLRPIGLQALRFVLDNEMKSSYDALRTSLRVEERARNLPAIAWTMRGVFDEEKVFMMLLRKVEKRGRTHSEYIDYTGACKFCLEGAITHLYGKVYSPLREHMKMVENHSDHSYWVAYWTCKLSNDMPFFMEGVKKHYSGKKKNIYQYLMDCAIQKEHVLAVRYLWSQMQENEKTKSVVEWAIKLIRMKFYDNTFMKNSSKLGAYQRTSNITDIMCFFLSNINDIHEQRELLENNTHLILQSLFFTWPWQELFLPMFKTLGHHCSYRAYAHLLSDMASNMESPGVTQVFRDIWRATPNDYRRSYIEWLARGEGNHDNLLGKSIRADDMSCVQLVLDDADVEVRKELIFRLVSEKYEFFLLISRNKLHVIDQLTDRYGLTETDVADLKQKASKRFPEFFESTYAETEIHDVWTAGQNLVRWCFQSQIEIDQFKAEFEPMGRLFGAVVDCLIYKGDFTTMDAFFSWCGHSEEMIQSLKREVALTRRFVVLKKLCSKGWLSLQEFIYWCCNSEEDISKLKQGMSEVVWNCDDTCATLLASVLLTDIKSEQRPDSTERIVQWLFGPVRTLEAKRNLLLSDSCLELIERFVDSSRNSMKFEEFVEFFRPLGHSAVVEFEQFVRKTEREMIVNGKSGPKWLPFKRDFVLRMFDRCISTDCEQNLLTG